MSQIHELLQATKPPLELIDHLNSNQERRRLAPSVLVWLERWQRIYRGDPDPAIDNLLQEAQP
mgnify:CR=1 FL=1